MCVHVCVICVCVCVLPVACVYGVVCTSAHLTISGLWSVTPKLLDMTVSLLVHI